MSIPKTDSVMQTTWQSPSNIAIIKYWGKRPIQIPVNASVSFSLTKACTVTSVEARPGKRGFSFSFEGKDAPGFRDKTALFLSRTQRWIPAVNRCFLAISSRNTFPHSSGIASSASSMSALALCLIQLESQLKGTGTTDFRMASRLARLGSGSAARSIYGGWSLWGRLPKVPESSNLYTIPLPVVPAPVFQTLHDDILIISSKKKSVSSSRGHSLMNNHPYQQSRVKQARDNAQRLLSYLTEGDLEGFIHITENEALSLHALMMSSTPGYTLMHPNTIEVINRVTAWRQSSKVPIAFTLDAGPNVHLLYPREFKSQVREWINHEIIHLCEQNKIINDLVGPGPMQVHSNPI